MKCILLLNRIPARNVRHELAAALHLIEQHAPFDLRLSETSRKLIKHLDTYGRFRYLETPFYVMGLELVQLDRTIWEIRRYCAVLDYQITLSDGNTKAMFHLELDKIEKSVRRPPHEFKLFGGALEKILDNKKHPAREALVWQNLYFGSRARKQVRLARYMHSTNSPLSLHPEILDDVIRYVLLPKEVVNAYQAELTTRSKKRSASSASRG